MAAGTQAGEELSKGVAQLRVTIEKVNKGEGTAGRLLNDGQLYEDLLENATQMKLLLEKWNEFIENVNKKGKLPIALK